MLDEENYTSDSSDDDYVPTGVESDVEELTEESVSDNDDDGDDTKSKKRESSSKMKKAKKSRNSKNVSEESEKSEDKESSANPEDEKKRLDSLWASFKEPVDSKEVKNTSITPNEVKQTTSKIFEFAGEKIEIQEEVKPAPSSSSQQSATKRPPIRSGGLSSLTSQLTNKKSKLSTLEKSKLDWDRFKNDEGIAEDLKSFNQGKMGFLERQAFLERADLKQFEIEKNFRAGRKPN